MHNKHTMHTLKQFELLPDHLYKGAVNRGIGAAGVSKTLSEEEYQSYRAARVERLRQLYEENPVEIKKTYVLPKGETDGRKSYIVEELVGEDFSPFDMPDFEEQMPDWTDYINKYVE